MMIAAETPEDDEIAPAPGADIPPPPEPVFDVDVGDPEIAGPVADVPAPPTPDLAPKAVPEQQPVTIESAIRDNAMFYDMDLRRSIALSMEADRTRAARAVQIARDLGENPDVVAARLKEYEAELGMHQLDLDTLKNDYPALSVFLSEEWNAALTSDDVKPWQYVTDTMASAFGDPLRTTVGMGLSGFGKTVSGSMMNTPMDFGAGGPLILAASQALTPVGDVIQNIGENISPPPERANFATQLSGALGQTAANVGLFATQPHLALALMFGVGAESQYQRIEVESDKIQNYLSYLETEAERLEDLRSPEAYAIRNHMRDLQERADDLDDPLMQLTSMIVGGGVTSVSERVQAGILLRKIPGMDAAMDGIMKTMPQFLQSKILAYGAKIAAAGTSEAVQEVTESFGQDLVSYFFYNPDQEFLQEWETEAAVGGVSGAIAQAGILYLQSLAAGGRRAHTVAQQQQDVIGKVDMIKDLQQTVMQTKLMERDPALAGQLLKMIGEDMDSTVYLTPEVTNVLYQSGVDPAAMMAADPELAADMNRARSTGDDIEISVERLVNVMAQGQGAYDFLTDYIKTSPEGIDYKSAIDMQEDANQYMRDLMDEERAEQDRLALRQEEAGVGQALEDRIRDGIMLSDNRAINPPATARKYAALMRRMYETIAKSAGDNTALLERLNARVNALSVRQRRDVALKPDQMTLLINKLRDVKSGKIKPGKRRSQYPVRNYIVKKGGIKQYAVEQGGMYVENPAVGELRAIGLDKTPRLVRKNGKVALDNIPVADMAKDLDIDPSMIRDDGNGYVDPQWILEQLRDENFGNPLMSEADIKRDQDDEILDELDRMISQAELSLRMSDKEIVDGLRRYAESVTGDTMYQGDRGFISFAENGDAVINLLEGADLTTFLHEAGHFWLSIMRDIYADPAANEQMRQDWDGTKKWWKENAADLLRDIKKSGPYKVHENADKTFSVRMMGRDVADFSTKAEADAHAKKLHDDVVASIESGGGIDWISAFIDSGRSAETDAEIALFVAMDEYFARGFETYLMKGEAPSQEVRGLFRAFSAWISRVYNYAKDVLGVNVSPEMSAIFDRLVATEMEIESQKESKAELFRPNPNTLEMLNKDQQAAYIRQQERQAQAAREKAFRKAMRQHERKNTQWYKEQRAALRAEVEEMSRTEPLYRALNLILKGEDQHGNKVGDPRKLDRKAVEEIVGKEGLRFLPRGVTVERGGVAPSIIAAMSGFRDQAAMIHAMLGAPSFKDHVEQETDKIMIERHGDMLNDGSIEQEALEHLMAEEAKAQIMELKALSEQTGVEYPSDGDFKKAAASLIRGLKVDEAIKPEKYLRAALRYAKEYGKAMGRRDYDAAAEAKRKEILNRYLYKMSVEARRDVEKSNKHFAALSRRPKRKERPKIDPAYLEKIQDLLKTVNIIPRVSSARALRLEMSAINSWIQELQKDETAVLQVPAALETADGVTHYRDMELGEYLAFRDLISNIEKQGRMKMELIVDGEKRDLNEQAEAGADYIFENNKLKKAPYDPESVKRLTPWRAIKSTSVSVINLSRKIETVIDMLAGHNKEAYDFLWKRIREPLFKAETKERAMQIKASRALADIMFKHYGRKSIKVGDKTHWVTSEDLTSPNTEIFISEKVGKMRREEIIMVAHYWGNADGRDRLLNDPVRNFTEADINAILSFMRQKDVDYLQDIWDYYDTFWPDVEATEKARYGYAPEKVEAVPFEIATADGKIIKVKGGYAPLKYDGMLNTRAAEQSADEIAKQFMIGKPLSTNTKNGSTYERTSGVKLSVKLNFGVIQQHVSETIHDLSMGDALRDVTKFLRHAKMQEAITGTHGMDVYNEIMVWLADTAVGSVRATSEAERMAAGIRHTMTMGALGLRVSTVALQITGLSNSVVEIGAPWVMRGLAQYAKMGGIFGAGTEIGKLSEFMNQRPETFNVNVAESINKLRNKGGALEAGQSAMLVPMMRMQYMVDCITWLSAHAKAVSGGASDADAITAADLAVERAQSGGAFSSLSAIERGTVGKNLRVNEFIKSMTWMMSYFNTKFNIAYRKTAAVAKRPDPLKVAGLIGDYAILFWFEFLIGEMLLGKVPDFDDEDDPEAAAASWLLWGGVSTAAAGVGFLRDAVGVMQGFSAAPAYAKGMDQAAKSLTDSAREFYRLATGDEDADVYNLFRKALTAGNYVSPVKLPTSQINQIVRGIEKAGEEDTSPLDYIVYRE